jgi:hypothetical protein
VSRAQYSVHRWRGGGMRGEGEGEMLRGGGMVREGGSIRVRMGTGRRYNIQEGNKKGKEIKKRYRRKGRFRL